MPLTFDETIEQLGDAKSPKRRQAAKRLRKLADPAAGPALLAAFEKEVQDARTWETQYQLTMALGACNCASAVPALMELAQRDLEATIVYMGLGDALVRVGRSHQDDPTPLVWCLDQGKALLTRGALQATAMLGLVLPDEVIDRVLALASARPRWDWTRFYVASAALSWKHRPGVVPFLQDCLSSSDQQVREAAANSLAAKQTKHCPA